MLNKTLNIAILSRNAKTLDRFLLDLAHDMAIGSLDLYRCELNRTARQIRIRSVDEKNVIFDIRGFTQHDDYSKVAGYVPDAFYVHDIMTLYVDSDVTEHFYMLESHKKTLRIRDDYMIMVGQIRRIAELNGNGVKKKGNKNVY